MANTFELIASQTAANSTTATYTFSSIPSTYTDLVLKYSCRNSAGQQNITMQFNGISSGYTYRMLYGEGSAAYSFNQATFSTSSLFAGIIKNTTSTFMNGEMYIPNYTNTSYNKSVNIDTVQEENITTAYMQIIGGIIPTTSAISSIAITTGNFFAEHSSFYLYGIKNS
jgi:hypothetical protein